jgi:LPXTG-motif cell wall-anchored protein
MNIFVRTSLYICLGLIGFGAQAKQFKTQFFSLHLPPNWDCVKEELDWVCQPDNLHERSEVFMVVVTKAVDPIDDNLKKYMEVLNQPRTLRNLRGDPYQSEVRYTRINKILDREWVDSLQFGSEIPGFYTRYLASIAEKVAGLVTYAIADSTYAKWAPVMERMIGTIELKFDPQAFEQLSQQSGSLLSSRGGAFGGRTAAPDVSPPEQSTDGDSESSFIILALVIFSVGGYWFYKKKKKEG